MHQPDQTPRKSVFYDYQVFPFQTPPEMTGAAPRHPVVIIGAGPIGMLLALELAQQKVASVIIESEAQISHGSRAIVLTRRTLEILQQAGVDAPFVEKGLPWQFGRSFYQGTEVYKMVMPYDENDRFMPGLNIQQQYIEEFLVAAIAASPYAEIRWQTRFVSLDQDPDGVTLTLDTPQGEYALQADWCVASDGGRSAVRKQLGLRMTGDAYPGNFVIADILAPIDLPTERQCHFDPQWNPGNNVLVHRQPDGLWRLDFRLPDGESPEQALAEESLTERINLILEMIGQPVNWTLDWATVYSANALTLPDYRQGRVLFCGDAAHVLPIFGVRGANTGAQDAQNLAWKLALVAQGAAGPRLLDSYSHERVKAALEICGEAGKSTRFMSPPTRGYRLLRDAVLSFSLSESFAKDFMHWRTSRPHDYVDSPLNAPQDDNQILKGGMPNGAPAGNVKLGADDFLLDHCGPQFVILVFAVGGQLTAAQQDILQLRMPAPIAVKTIAIGARADAADESLPDPNGKIGLRFGLPEGGVYVLRPDQHVCGRWVMADRDTVAAAIQNAVSA
ncbi:MAG: FAD-dependent monooxygenase [Magnetospiraceae bacterium]